MKAVETMCWEHFREGDSWGQRCLVGFLGWWERRERQAGELRLGVELGMGPKGGEVHGVAPCSDNKNS